LPKLIYQLNIKLWGEVQILTDGKAREHCLQCRIGANPMPTV